MSDQEKSPSDAARDRLLGAIAEHKVDERVVEIRLPGNENLPVKIKPLTFKGRNRIAQKAAAAGDDQITSTIVQAIIRCCVSPEDGAPIFLEEDARALERSAPGGVVDQLSEHIQSVLAIEDPEGNG